MPRLRAAAHRIEKQLILLICLAVIGARFFFHRQFYFRGINPYMMRMSSRDSSSEFRSGRRLRRPASATLPIDSLISSAI